jgi:hypothetical protein
MNKVMSFLKEEFDLLLRHDWDEKTVLCIEEMYKSLKMYKYLLNKYTIDNIGELLRLANHIKIELKLKETEIELLNDENDMLKRKISKLKHLELEQLNLI